MSEILWVPGRRRGELLGPCGSPYTITKAMGLDGSSAWYAEGAGGTSQLNATSVLISAWVYLTSTAASVFIAGKLKSTFGATPSQSEYGLRYNSGAGAFSFCWCDTAGPTAKEITNNTAGFAISTNTWYHVLGFYNGSSTHGIFVNAAHGNTPGAISTPQTSKVSFRIGRTADDAWLFPGRIQSVGVWIGGNATGSSQGTFAATLYNSGAGKRYADLAAGDKTGLQAWWELWENTSASTYCDYHSTNHLTKVGSPTQEAGLF